MLPRRPNASDLAPYTVIGLCDIIRSVIWQSSNKTCANNGIERNDIWLFEILRYLIERFNANPRIISLAPLSSNYVFDKSRPISV